MKHLFAVIVLAVGLAGCASGGPIEINGQRMTVEEAKLRIVADSTRAFDDPVRVRAHKGATEEDLLTVVNYLNRAGYKKISMTAK